jgi:predicted PurR-regulated permease PerM
MSETETVVTPHHGQPGRPPYRFGPFIRPMAVAAATIALIALLLLLWYVVEVLLLVFAGMLLAVFLRGLRDGLGRYTPLRGNGALLVLVITLLAIFGVGIWLLAPQLGAQIMQLTETLPRSILSLEERLRQYGFGQWLLSQTPSPGEFISEGSILAKVTRVFSTTFGALASLLVILATGLYMAVAPDVYTEGVIRLVPVENRARAREVLRAVGQTLRWWLLGRWASMVVVGLLTAAGLWLIGVPLALTFGLLAALLTFIPYLGPILSAVPPTLLAFAQQPQQALYVILLYLGIQSVESYLVTPLVQQRTVSLPPALTLTAQVVLGILLGGLGVILATPLFAAVVVLVKMLYIEDMLGERQ